MDQEIIEIESKIEKDSKQKKMVVGEEVGRDAYTKITLLKKYQAYSFVEIEIETGRMHQIRLHASSIGYPVAGDSKYSTVDYKILNKKLNLKRFFLHAYYLSFFYGQKYEFILDLPSDLKEVLSILEKDNE